MPLALLNGDENGLSRSVGAMAILLFPHLSVVTIATAVPIETAKISFEKPAKL
jgi:hypothetical protein